MGLGARYDFAAKKLCRGDGDVCVSIVFDSRISAKFVLHIINSDLIQEPEKNESSNNILRKYHVFFIRESKLITHVTCLRLTSPAASSRRLDDDPLTRPKSCRGLGTEVYQPLAARHSIRDEHRVQTRLASLAALHAIWLS